MRSNNQSMRSIEKPARIELILFTVVFVFGLIANSISGINHIGDPDGYGYYERARGLSMHWRDYQSHPEFFEHGPGLIVLLALTFLVSSSTNLLLFKILLCVVHAISSILVYKIASKLVDRFWIAVGAAVFFSLDPFITASLIEVGTESITTLAVLYWCHELILMKTHPKVYNRTLRFIWISISAAM